MRQAIRLLGIVMSLLVAEAARAEDAARAPVYRVTLTQILDTKKPQLLPLREQQQGSDYRQVDNFRVVDGVPFTLEVLCAKEWKPRCGDVVAKVVGDDSQHLLEKTKVSDTVMAFNTPLTKLASSIQVLLGTTPVGTVDFVVTDKSSAPVANSNSTSNTSNTKPTKLADIVESSQNCEFSPADAARSSGYDAEKNLARVVVRPNGNLLSRLPRNFDEDDTLEVVVVLREALVPYIQVKRKSEFGAPGSIRILGEDVQVPSALIETHATGTDEAKAGECREYVVPLRDFAPGRGEVELLAVKGGQATTLGTFEFAVNSLYTGMFSLGPVWSWNEDPRPGVVSNGTQTIIANKERDKSRMLFAVLYTPFIWGKRDILKDQRPILALERFNPTLGVTLTNLPRNALVGVSWDAFNGAVLTGGLHLSRVSVLSPESGLKPGDPFDGPVDQLPTVGEWKTGAFVALTVDLRAAVSLIRTALTASTPAK